MLLHPAGLAKQQKLGEPNLVYPLSEFPPG
jgi:hypothetical protein